MQSAFGWANVVIQAGISATSRSQMQRSLLCSSPGTSSEFSGGACGWEVACQLLTVAGHRLDLAPRLSPLSCCDPKLQVMYKVSTIISLHNMISLWILKVLCSHCLWLLFRTQS